MTSLRGRRYVTSCCCWRVDPVRKSDPSAPLHAECIIPGAWWLQSPHFEVVFTGTVTLIERTSDLSYRATITVHRVWKGQVQSQVTVDVNELPPETPRFQNNVHYLPGQTAGP